MISTRRRRSLWLPATGLLALGCGGGSAPPARSAPVGRAAPVRRPAAPLGARPCNEPGCAIWAARFGGPGDDTGEAVTFGQGDRVYVVGTFAGRVDFRGNDLTSAGPRDAFVAQYDPAGHLAWARSMGGEHSDYGAGVAADPSGAALVTGTAGSQIDAPAGQLTGYYGDPVIARYAPDGTPAWFKLHTAETARGGQGIAADGAGNAYVALFGVDPVLLAKYGPKGEHVWSARFQGGDHAVVVPKAIATDRAGTSVVTGSFEGTVDLGGGSLTSAGQRDVFVAVYDPQGTLAWAKRFGGRERDYGLSVAIDAGGDLLVAGHFQGSIDFGGAKLDAAGDYDAFVVKLRSSGEHVWSRRFGGAGRDAALGVAGGESGSVLAAGYIERSADLGGTKLESAGDRDAIVAKYTSAGVRVWARRFGGASVDWASGVAVGPAGHVAVAGKFAGAIDVDGTRLASAGKDDVFVAVLRP